MKRKDPLTGNEFTPKRANQKFEYPANRIAYYNKKANAHRAKNSFINKLLHTNVKLLNVLLHNKVQATFKKDLLHGKGFSFNVHTHYEVYNGETRHALYQYIIIPINNDEIKIVKTC